MKKTGLIATLLVSSLLFAGFDWLRPVVNKPHSGRFAERVNLSLRRTAHRLLAEAGDSTSQILPVRHTNDSTFQVGLGHSLPYARLPALLQESFGQYRVTNPYEVAVLDCLTGELQLGYSVQDLLDKEFVPCVGRQQGRNCYTLQVTFTGLTPGTTPTTYGWLLGVGCLVAITAFGAWQWSRGGRRVSTSPAPAEAAHRIQLGQFQFDRGNQTLQLGSTQQLLTYREAKLLHLFATHPNQLLDRDFILRSVWGDEGIIVGRSIDVFVSRLRKLLRPDPSVQLVTVHGVGYRLEVK